LSSRSDLPLLLPLPVVPTHPGTTVISTEAAHGLIVSSAVERPAFLPKPIPSQNQLLLLLFVIP
jgi:hypothetical protein